MAKPWSDNPKPATLHSRHRRRKCHPPTCPDCLKGHTRTYGIDVGKKNKPKPKGTPKPRPVAPSPSPSPVRLGLADELLKPLLRQLADAPNDTALTTVWEHRNSLLPLMCTSDKERTKRVWELRYQILACDPGPVEPLAAPPEPVRYRRTPPPILIEREPSKGFWSFDWLGRKSSRVYATPASWGGRQLFAKIAEKVRTA